jgi:hypothetical protein
VTPETSLHADDRVDWHLRRAPLIVGALGIGRLPRDAELVERFAGGAREATRAVEHRLAREARLDRAAVDAIAEAHEAAVLRHTSQGAQHLIFAAEIGEFPRQEDGIAFLPGHPLLNLIAQRFPAAHLYTCAKTRHST